MKNIYFPEMTAKVNWTAIVLTCAKKEWGEAVQKGKYNWYGNTCNSR